MKFADLSQSDWLDKLSAVSLSKDPDWCPRLTPDHRRRSRMLAHRHQNWNHQHWSHVQFTDESIVWLYNCNGHARVFLSCCWKARRFLLLRHKYYLRAWWQQWHVLTLDSSSNIAWNQCRWFQFKRCLPTCGGSSDDQESVSGIGLDVLSHYGVVTIGAIAS